MKSVTRALISVSDKTGVVSFAQKLVELGIEIISTGGTAQLLKNEGLQVIDASDHTEFPEMLDGRVKTLHPKIHGGILGRRDLPEHLASMKAHNIQNIDLVCVNLYPFTQTIAKENCTLEEAIENIDIGGPAMVRSAAKNWAHVAILTDSNDYTKILEELTNNQNVLTDKTRFNLAKKAFSHTAAYDGAISNYLTSIDTEHLSGTPKTAEFPEVFNQQFIKVQDMRYGENPHQHAAFYRDQILEAGNFANYTQHQGKELSYNNIADADAAWEIIKDFTTDSSACVIVKHANPCGVATAVDPLEAYERAFASDSMSAFGGIIALNKEVTAPTAQKIISNQFLEVLIAPSYTDDALKVLSNKTNIRVLSIPFAQTANLFDFKRVGSGLLVQTPDTDSQARDKMQVVTDRQPSEQEWIDLLFAWKVIKHVKSNAIIFCKNNQTYGIGAGQTSRVDATRIAIQKASDSNFELVGSIVASDAFFPFKDAVEVIAKQGIKAIIHPGGSIKDQEIIDVANEYNISMVLTGMRHFKH